MTTSYFSSDPTGSNFGLRRGRGVAKDGSTRKSRDDVEYSVKTGISELSRCEWELSSTMKQELNRINYSET